MERKVFLLADDDIDDREMFCEALSTIDNRIVCHAVADGRAALACIRNLEPVPDLIFLDVNMPVMNGWECLIQLKEEERYRDIPVIIISTSSSQREMDKAKHLEALCYFIKPHDFNDLMQVLRLIVAHTGSQLPAQLRELEEAGFSYIHTLTEAT